MATASDSTVATTPPPKGPAEGWAQRGGALSLAQRFLTLREGSIIVVTIIAFLYFALTSDRFLTGNSLKALLPYFAPFAIMAAGEVFVMINGEIDLSVGAVYLFTPFIFYKLSANVGLPLIPAMIGALIVSCLVGLFNGLVIAYIGIASFTTTLGTLFTLDGLTLIISHATQVTTPGTSVVSVGTFAQIFGGGTYSELFWAIGITIVLQLLLSLSRWGIYTVSVGGNRLGAAEAGVRTRRVLTGNFVMCALLAGFVGILEAVRSSSVTPDPSGSNAILFQVIAAAVIGGTLLQGGSGTVIGAFIGAIFLGVLQDGLIIKGVSANYFLFYLGLAVLIAMAFNTYVSRVRTGSGRGG
jgi:simple sugar transport system permease protein